MKKYDFVINLTELIESIDDAESLAERSKVARSRRPAASLRLTSVGRANHWTLPSARQLRTLSGADSTRHESKPRSHTFST